MDLIETKKNLRTYLRFFNKNVDEGSILTNILLYFHNIVIINNFNILKYIKKIFKILIQYIFYI